MFDFLGRQKKTNRRATIAYHKGRGPVTIGFEQLEVREMLSSGLAVTIVPSGLPPLASMPRPIIGSFNPESGGEGRVEPTLKVRHEPDLRWMRPWPLGGRFRFG
jgi:hypothetical protein